MLSTPWGSHLTVVIINKTTPIKMVYKDGILLKNLSLAELSLQQNNTNITAQNVVLKLQASCVWVKKLCIDKLAIGDLHVTVNQAEEHVEERTLSKEFIEFPFVIDVQKITSDTTTVTVDNTTINSEKLKTGILLKNSLIHLRNPSIDTLQVTLSNHTSNTQKKAIAQTNKTDKAWPLANLPTIHLPFILKLENADINTFTLKEKKSEDAILVLNQNLSSLQWQASDLTIQTFKTHHGVYGSGSLKGDIQFEFPYQLNVTTASDLTNIELLPQLAGSQHKTTLKGDLSALNAVSQLTGETELLAEVKIDLTQQSLPFEATATVNKLPFIDELLNSNQATTATLETSGNIEKQRFNVHAVVNARGYTNAAIHINGLHKAQTLTVKSLTLKEANTQSELTVKGQWVYHQGNIVQLTADSSGLNLPLFPENKTIPTGRLAGTVSLNGKVQNETWSLTLENSSLKGSLNNTPVNAFGTLAFNSEWQIKPSHLLLNVGDATLKMNGYTDQNWHVKGELDIPKLEQFIADSRGTVNTTFTIDGARNNPNVKLSNTVKQFYWQYFASPEFSLQANYRPFKKHLTTLTVNSEKILWKEREFFKVNAVVDGDIEQQKTTLNWLGDLAANIALTSSWSPKNKQWHAQITDNTLQYSDKTWQSDKNITLTYQPATQSLKVNQHCWLGKSITLCTADDIVIKDAGEIMLTADIHLTEVGDLFIPDDILITTQLHNKIHVKWAPLTPINWSVTTDIEAGNIKLLTTEKLNGQPLNISWQKGTGLFKLHKNKLTAEILLDPQQAAQQALFNVNSVIDLTNNQLTGQFKANDLSLFFLQGYFSEIRELNGTLNADVKMQGDLASPIFNGNIDITNTDIKVVRSINTINDLALNIELLGDKATLTGESLINTDKAKVSGELNWQEAFTAQFNFNADSLNLMHPPLAKATISPNLNIDITKNTLKLTGDIDINQGEITLTKLPTGSVGISDDVIVVNDDGVEIEKTTRFALETDVNINIANNIDITGYGFNGVLGGKLQAIQKPHYALQLFGNLTIIDGLYKAYGQKLAVNNGRLSFNGPIKNPLVDLRAARNIPKENVIAGIEIYGPANALAVNLFSTPTKSKAEILSYIVRGKGIDTSTQNNNSLGITLGATLASASGLLETIEKIPLINNLEIEGDEKQASIAGYIGDNIYLKYGVGVAEPINELTVRFYLLNRLWIETVSGLERSADLYFSFDVE